MYGLKPVPFKALDYRKLGLRVGLKEIFLEAEATNHFCSVYVRAETCTLQLKPVPFKVPHSRKLQLFHGVLRPDVSPLDFRGDRRWKTP